MRYEVIGHGAPSGIAPTSAPELALEQGPVEMEQDVDTEIPHAGGTGTAGASPFPSSSGPATTEQVS